MKPERWGSALVQGEKCQGGEGCDRRNSNNNNNNNNNYYYYYYYYYYYKVKVK
jgi:hypothetical protein